VVRSPPEGGRKPAIIIIIISRSRRRPSATPPASVGSPWWPATWTPSGRAPCTPGSRRAVAADYTGYQRILGHIGRNDRTTGFWRLPRPPGAALQRVAIHDLLATTS